MIGKGKMLLEKFLAEIHTTKPERFYGIQMYDGDKFREYPNDHWEVELVKEACYHAYDAVMFRRRNGEIVEIIPIEVKSDEDVCDDGRLRAQIWVHLKNFGKSLLVVDSETAFKIKKLKLDKMLPSEIWAYNGVNFYQLSEPIFKFYYGGSPHISKRAIEKAFGVYETPILNRIQKKVNILYSILGTLAANQWRWKNEKKLSEVEAELAREVFGYELSQAYKTPKILQKPLKIKPEVKQLVENIKSTGFDDKLLQKTLFESSISGKPT
jgi:hypothetical protein